MPCRASGLFWHCLEVLPAVEVAALACDPQPMESRVSCSSEPSGCRVSGIHVPGAYRLAGEIASCERCREVLSISFHFISSSRTGWWTPHVVGTIEKVLKKENVFVRHGAARCDGTPRDKCVVGRPGFGRGCVSRGQCLVLISRRAKASSADNHCFYCCLVVQDVWERSWLIFRAAGEGNVVR